MPRRRRKSEADDMWDAFVELCAIGPWWIGPVGAVVAFVVVGGVFPALFGMAGDEIRNVFVPLSQKLAPWAAGLALLAWLVGLVERWKRRSWLDSRTGPESLRHMSWQDFELLVGEAYRRQGYTVKETGGGGADGGVDLILRKKNETTLVQCKRWKTYKVGVKIVRELFGVMASEEAYRGIIATCGRYTRDAVAFAEDKPIELLDGPALWRLVEQGKKNRTAVDTSDDATKTLETKGIADVAFCPKCGSALVLRTARKGAHAGSKFYGCSQYPKCRFIRSETSSTQT